MIASTKPYVPVVTLSSNNNIKLLENLKQRFKRIIYWNKYRSEIAAQPKKQFRLQCLIQHLRMLIDCLFNRSIINHYRVI